MNFWFGKVGHGFRVVILMILVIFLCVGCKMEGKLITEIQSSGELDRFKPKDVSSIVAKYIPFNTEKQEALRQLKNQGFHVEEAKKTIPSCPDCDDLVILASYMQKAIMPFLPYKSYISMVMGVRNGKVVHIAAYQSGNPF